MRILIILLHIIVINSYEFIKQFKIYNELKKLTSNNISKKPIIINSLYPHISQDYCRIYSKLNNINFLQYNFNNFMFYKPHLNNKNYIIYIKNKYYFNDSDLLYLKTIPFTTNLIIFDNNYKLNNIYNKIDFNDITKDFLEKYIYQVIKNKNYSKSLLLLNWSKYNIEKLNFEKINILLYELNDNVDKFESFNALHKIIDNMIEILNICS